MPILLLIVISINHLNMGDIIMHCISTTCKDSAAQKNFPSDEETEKENACKDKSEEQEKFYTGNSYLFNDKFLLSATDKFICFNTALNKHPYQDDVIQPPQSV